MKKFINKVENIIDEMLTGFSMANPDLVKRIDGFNVIVRKEINPKKVGIISGGGSGHEPAHVGYVGFGMLDAAIAGEVFTSPTPDQIYEAIKAVATDSKKAFLVVKNYTGDVMNFEMAADLAAADGIETESVIVDDDIALENSTYTTGKRGIAGTVFVHKIVGAAAEAGLDLPDIKKLADKVVANIASYGISLDGTTVPANGKKGFSIPEDEVEMGLGIHGEPGVERIKLKTADEHITDLMNHLTTYLKLQANDKVGVLVNGLGATPAMELDILARKTLMILDEMQVSHEFVLVGNYMTSIDMPGFSLTLIKLDEQMEGYLKATANTVALKVM